MTDGASSSTPELVDRNPVLATGSRVPGWVALGFTLVFCAGRVIAAPSQPLSISSALGVAWWLGVALVIIAAIPQRVEVGAEGLRVAWLGRPRLIHYDEVMRAAPVGDEDVALTFASGEAMRLCRTPLGDASPRAILERIWTTLAAGAEDGAAPIERAALARRGRTFEAWAAALRGVSAAGVQYRQGLTLERLVALAENPAEDVALRAAAAVAVSSALDAEGRKKLGSVASTTMESSLRDALRLVLAARDEATLAAALRRAAT